MSGADDPDRAAILARRRRFVTAALAGLATTGTATACPCLKIDSTTSDPMPDTTSETDDTGEPETSSTSAAETSSASGSTGTDAAGERIPPDGG